MKRNKKRNPTKILKMQSAEMIANTGIYQLPGNKCEFVSFNNKPYSPKGLLKIYNDMRHKWTVALIVFRVNEKGDKAITVEHVSPPNSCLADQIADSVKSQHEKMMRKCDNKEFIAGGWLALPRDEILSSVKILDLFDKLDVWRDYVTNNGYKLKGE